MDLAGLRFTDNVTIVIRVQKLSMPGTGGEPAGSPYISQRATRARPLQERLRVW